MFYVSPAGDDSWEGSFERPFLTLERARSAAREVPGEAVVRLMGGTHVLTRPFELTEADSGTVYEAYGHGTAGQEEAVISGGRPITEWRVRDGVWRAEVGDLEVRQLYVDGRRAARAAIPGLPGAAEATGTGYVTDSTEPLAWRSAEFVHRGVYPWSEARLGMAAAEADGGRTVITMAQPGFGWAMELYNSVWEGNTSRGPGLPTAIENDPAFLREPGTFALDRSRPGSTCCCTCRCRVRILRVRRWSRRSWRRWCGSPGRGTWRSRGWSSPRPRGRGQAVPRGSCTTTGAGTTRAAGSRRPCWERARP
ncbi:hypothetical protein ACFQQB_15965 [Nonomuraea rubra]|uniref:hypothetical protein n=1 Tax=Nonomuraea rubra TaxID=46180 RepID=UPI003612EF50